MPALRPAVWERPRHQTHLAIESSRTFRNIWAWDEQRRKAPQIVRDPATAGCVTLTADDSAALGAAHQTGWTGLVASLIAEWRD